MHISKYRLELYARCPYLFRRVAIDNIEMPESYERQLGKAFHSFAYCFFDWVNLDQLRKCETLQDTTDYFSQSLENISSRHLRKLCQNFIEWEAEQWIRLRDYRFFPVLREAFVSLEVGKVTFAGIVDRVDKLNGEYCVLEYKVGPFTKTRIRRETAYYATLLNKAGLLPGKVTYWAVYSPVDKLYIRQKIHHATLRALKGWLMKVLRSIKDDDFPRKLSDACGSCFLLSECMSYFEKEEEMI